MGGSTTSPTRETFERMIAAGEFLEWAEVFGNYYGTGFSALEKARAAGRDLLLDIDVQGAVQVMRKMPEAVSIFILPPSPQVLEMRLRNRSEAEHMTSEEVIERRLTQARKELEQLWDYKYALVNDVLDQATAEMRAIVLYERGVRDGVTAVAEGCRTDARSARLKAALRSFGRLDESVQLRCYPPGCGAGQMGGVGVDWNHPRGANHVDRKSFP